MCRQASSVDSSYSIARIYRSARQSGRRVGWPVMLLAVLAGPLLHGGLLDPELGGDPRPSPAPAVQLGGGPALDVFAVAQQLQDGQQLIVGQLGQVVIGHETGNASSTSGVSSGVG